MGTTAASAGAAGPSEGLRAGRSSGRTKAGAHSGERTTRPRDYGSGPTCQSDVRDSEPDYLLRPTMHGPGGTLLIIAHSSFSTNHCLSVGSCLLFKGRSFKPSTSHCSQRDVTFESVIKGPPALAEDSVLTPIPVWRILVLFSNREESEGAV